MRSAGLLSLFLLLAVFAEPVFGAELSDAEKAAKREQLSQHFTAAVERTEPGSERRHAQALRYRVTGSTRLGYDDNVGLDSVKDDDIFYQERAGATVEYDVSGWNIEDRPVTVGVDTSYSYLGYFDRDDMNRQSGKLSPFVRMRLKDRVTLEAGYVYRGLRYDEQKDLNFNANGARVSISQRLAVGLYHKGEFRYEHLSYTDRKQLNPFPVYTSNDREDNRHQAAYGFRYHSGRWTTRLEGSWMRNDSNDQYLDYNDYDDLGLDGSVSVRTTERWILTGFGGWHSRSFDSRAAIVGSTDTQEDSWYYAGGRVYFALNTWSGFDITATYNENVSNNSAHEYSDFISSAGYHLYF
jgi:hypothetical protein